MIAKQKHSLRLGNEPIGKLLFTMSIPAIISMLMQAVYNIVDSYYLAQYSATDFEIKAMTFAFPMQILLIGFALGVGIGTSSLISRKLGEKNTKDASNAAKTGIILAIACALFFALVSVTLVKPYMRLVSNIPTVQEYGTTYIRIVMAFSLGLFLEIIGNRILQGMGRMVIPMATQLIGAITNILLDPIFIFGRYGIPEMGIQGAAIATVIAQFLACIFVMGMLFIKRKELDVGLSFRGFRLQKQVTKDIIRVGAPATIMNSIGSITILSLTQILNRLDPEENASAVLGIYFRLQSFIFMPVFGLTQGGMPILVYNYGANNQKRFYHTLRLLLITAFLIMASGTTLFLLRADWMIQIFSDNEEFIQIGARALRIYSLTFMPASISIIVTVMFQAMGHGFKSLLLTLLRQLILLLPLSFLFSLLFGLQGVWFAYPLGEILVFLFAVPIAFKIAKKEFSKKAALLTVTS